MLKKNEKQILFFSRKAIKAANETRLQLVIYYEIAALCVTPFRIWFVQTIRKSELSA